MRLRETVTSKWLKVDDLPGREQGHLDLTIRAATMDKFEDGRPTLDLAFHEHPKPLGCNVTNRKRLLLMFGENVELHELAGKRIRLHAELTQNLDGSPCWGIRIVPIPDTIALASAEARAKIEASRLRAAGGAPTMAQEAPPAFQRPMSHRPASAPPGPAWPAEPAGFVDDQDPGPSDPFEAGGRW
jgi:hypothetical protein